MISSKTPLVASKARGMPQSEVSASSANQVQRGRLRRLWKAIDEMNLEIAVTYRSVTGKAIELMSDPGLSPRDSFHASHALDSGCPVIVSSDPNYDRLTDLRRVGPY